MVHLTGLLITVGTVSLWDLRLLGASLREIPVSRVGKALLPWTWAGFCVMALSGAAMKLDLAWIGRRAADPGEVPREALQEKVRDMSAMIDQIRFRRAMNLPFELQKV